MALPINFREAAINEIALAKVGNPLKGEPLLTSKNLCRFEDDEADLLTTSFLIPFKSLEPYRLEIQSSSESPSLREYVKSIFHDESSLLEEAKNISQYLYSKSYHPNIKSGDLCISLIDGIIISGQSVPAICIIKCENKTPFLQISEIDGDLKLTTQHGIYPDKIDKGCLVLNHEEEEGFVVYLFDKSGNTNFWNKDFVNALPVRDDDYLTKRFGELCVNFAKRGIKENNGDNKSVKVANNALNYLAENEDFNISEFEKVLGEPEIINQFSSFKSEFEEDSGYHIDDSFKVSKKEANRAKQKLKERIKLDTGAEVHLSSQFIDNTHEFLETGFDEEKNMKYLKIFFNEEI